MQQLLQETRIIDVEFKGLTVLGIKSYLSERFMKKNEKKRWSKLDIPFAFKFAVNQKTFVYLFIYI